MASNGRGGRRPDHAKSMGAYYTDAAVADFLVGWAVRSPRDLVLDPSCGDGVFLAAASNRLKSLGGDVAAQVHGVEINPAACERTREALGLPGDNVRLADFFGLED